MLIEAKPRILKPSSPQLQIDWSNPLARGLLSCLTMQGPRLVDLVRPRVWTFNGTAPVTNRGISTQYNGTTQYASAPIDLSGTSLCTVVFLMKWNTFSTDDAQAIEYTNDSNSKNGFSIDPNSSNTGTAFEIGISTTGASYWADYFTRPSAGVFHHYVITFDRATPVNTAYVDGVAQSLTSILHSGASFGNFDNSTIYLMSRGGASLWATGNMAFFALYNRILTQAEAISLSAAPYSFIQSVSRSIPAGVVISGGGGFTALNRRSLGPRVGSRSA